MVKASPPSKHISTRARVIAKERKHSAKWFYLSFATDYAYLGSVIVWAHGIETAKQRAADLGISPVILSAEVMCVGLTRQQMKQRVPANLRNRLLNKADIERLEGKGAE